MLDIVRYIYYIILVYDGICIVEYVPVAHHGMALWEYHGAPGAPHGRHEDLEVDVDEGAESVEGLEQLLHLRRHPGHGHGTSWHHVAPWQACGTMASCHGDSGDSSD